MPEREQVPQEEVARLREAADRALADADMAAAGAPGWEPTREQQVDAVRRLILDREVGQFVAKVQLAAELYPGEIRAALAYLFDTTAAEERLAQVVTLANRVEAKLAAMLDASAWAERDLAPSLNAMLAQADRIETASRFVAGLTRRVAALEKKVTTSLDFLRGLVMWANGRGFRPRPGKAAQPQKGQNDGKGRNVQGPPAGQPRAGQA